MLHEAVNRGDMDVVNAVVECRSLDINQTTYDDKTPLDMAISRQCAQAQTVLLSAGAVCGPATAEDMRSPDRDSDQLSDMDWSV